MKPVVNFKRNSLTFFTLFGKERAELFPINHPDSINVSNTKMVVTSEVIQKTFEGSVLTSFETKNTIYIPI